MSINRAQHFIRNILQNSMLNREKFVKNKKLYNQTIFKNKNNHNLIFKRKFSTHYSGFPPPNNNKGGHWVFMLMVATTCYIVSKR
jgi:hypothetical protein